MSTWVYCISIESSASHQHHRPSGHGTRSFLPTPRFISQTMIWIYCFGRSYYLAFVRVFSRASVFFSISTFRKILRASARSLADLSRAYLDRVCPRTVRASSRELFFAARENPLTWKAVNSTPGMVSYMKPPKKGASSYVSRYAAIRDTIGLPHIDLIGSTSQIHSQNGRTERYFPTRHTFVS